MWIFVVLFFFIKIFFSSIKSRFYIFNFSNSVLFFQFCPTTILSILSNFVLLHFCRYILSNFVQNVQLCSFLSKMLNYVQNVQFCPYCPIIPNCTILSKMSNFAQNVNFVQNVQLCPKCPYCPILSIQSPSSRY